MKLVVVQINIVEFPFLQLSEVIVWNCPTFSWITIYPIIIIKQYRFCSFVSNKHQILAVSLPPILKQQIQTLILVRKYTNNDIIFVELISRGWDSNNKGFSCQFTAFANSQNHQSFGCEKIIEYFWSNLCLMRPNRVFN